MSQEPTKNKGIEVYNQMITKIVGRPIKTMEAFAAAVKASAEPRYLTMRALSGCLTKTQLEQSTMVSCVQRAFKVYEEAGRTMDPKMVKLFVEAGSRGKKRARVDCIQSNKFKAK